MTCGLSVKLYFTWNCVGEPLTNVSVGYSPIHGVIKRITRSNWRKKRFKSDIKLREQWKLYIKTYNSPSESHQSYQHTTDSTHALSSLVAFSFYHGSKQWMFYLSLCTEADRRKSHNLLKLYHKTLYEGKYEVRYISSRDFFFQVQGSVLCPCFLLFSSIVSVNE